MAVFLQQFAICLTHWEYSFRLPSTPTPNPSPQGGGEFGWSDPTRLPRYRLWLGTAPHLDAGEVRPPPPTRGGVRGGGHQKELRGGQPQQRRQMPQEQRQVRQNRRRSKVMPVPL